MHAYWILNVVRLATRGLKYSSGSSTAGEAGEKPSLGEQMVVATSPG
jgi:hypothetical protein